MIRRGRNFQRTLHIPECLRVFSDTDPGMEDESIRMGAELIGVACVFAIFGLGMVAPMKGTIFHVYVVVLGVVVPTCLVLVARASLIYRKRRWDKRLREVIALNLVMEEGLVGHDDQAVSGVDEKKLVKAEERQAAGYQISSGLQESINAICAGPFHVG